MAQEATLPVEDLDLTRLLHQSQQLSAKITGASNIPVILRGFEQIEAFSSALAASSGALSNESRYQFHVIANISLLH